MFFIPHYNKLYNRKPTYLWIVAENKPHKKEKKHIRFTVGGNRIEYKGKLATPTSHLTTFKIHLNSVVSIPGAKYGTSDITNFYLGTLLYIYEYTRINIHDIPDETIKQYNVISLVHNGVVIVEIHKKMYGLPEVEILFNNRLQKYLREHGYVVVSHNPGLFRHVTRPVSFTLVVDDFGIKYVNKCDWDHLLYVLKLKYDITSYISGYLYCNLNLVWDYNKRNAVLSIPNYVK